MYKKILVATDGSSRSEKAGGHAINMAKDCDAELNIISVADSGTPREAYDIDPDFHEETEEMTNVNVDELKQQRSGPEQQIAEHLKKEATDQGVSATSVVKIGDPAEEILAFARDSGSEVIVIGSHGHGALKSAMIGSVTSKIIHTGDIPVLVIPVHEG